jgi:plastocyanin
MSTTTEPTAPPVVDQPARAGDRTLAAGALAMAGLLVGVQLLATHVIPPLAVFAALYVVLGSVVARRRSRWSVGALLALAVLHVGGSVQFFVANLAHPESPASFLFEAFTILVGLAVIVGSVRALRGHTGITWRLAAGAGGFASVAVIVSLIAAASVDSAVQQPGDTVVETSRSAFPAHVEVPAGGAGLWIDNQDAFHHTLVIGATGDRFELPARTAVRAEVDLDPGTYRFHCDVPGHEDMVGEVTAS